MFPRKPNLHRAAGFSVVEALIASSVLVIGLLAVASATTSTQLLRKRSLDEEAVFRGMVSRLEQARGELFSPTPFHDAVAAAVAGGGTFEQGVILDNDQDGDQDVPFAAGDSVTPVMRLRVTAPATPGDPSLLLEVEVTATWYGVGGQRTRNASTLVANRSGFGG
jgi:hypothetical protein